MLSCSCSIPLAGVQRSTPPTSMATISFRIPAVSWRISGSSTLISSTHHGVACPVTVHLPIFFTVSCLAHGCRSLRPELSMSWDSGCIAWHPSCKPESDWFSEPSLLVERVLDIQVRLPEDGIHCRISRGSLVGVRVVKSPASCTTTNHGGRSWLGPDPIGGGGGSTDPKIVARNKVLCRRRRRRRFCFRHTAGGIFLVPPYVSILKILRILWRIQKWLKSTM